MTNIDNTTEIQTARLMSMRGWLKNIAAQTHFMAEHPTRPSAKEIEEVIYQINTNLGKIVNEVERALEPERFDD